LENGVKINPQKDLKNSIFEDFLQFLSKKEGEDSHLIYDEPP